MEMEDKECTDSGSLGLNSESDSPPSSGGAYGFQLGGGGNVAVVPETVNMAVDMSVEKNVAVLTSPTVAVGGGIISPGCGGGGGAVGGGVVNVVGSGGSTGELAIGKKKRGRPRKYDADGNLTPGYVKSPPVAAAAQPGFTLSAPPSYGYKPGSKRGRGKPAASGNWQVLASLGELFASTAGGDFTPHVVTVHAGEDVAGKILTFAQKDSRGICVLSANGSVSNVTLRQPGSSGGLLTYEGRFEILTLTGSYTISESGGMRSRTGGLSVSLSSSDGRVIGGGIAGLLMAASPIQVVVGTFLPNSFSHNKPQKRKHQTEPRMSSPVVQNAPPATVTAAIPISQAAPQIHSYPVLPTSQVLIQSRGDPDNSLSNRDHPNSASTDTAEWNGSGPSSDQRPSPDINGVAVEH